MVIRGVLLWRGEEWIAMPGRSLVLRDRARELADAGFEFTCRGEAAQGERWQGEATLCGRCGQRVDLVINRCGCKEA